MASTRYPLDIEVYRSWVDAILSEASDELTDWEINFIESIDQRLRGGRIPSEKQAPILERIYAEKTK
jgi:hypothetical protein